MASQNWTPATAVIQELLSNCQQFAFFQAVRLLEHSHPQSVPPGREGPVAREVIRFRPHATLAFPTCDIEAIEALEEQDGALPRFQMTVNFFGLYGPTSPLPTFYTEDLITSERDEDERRHFLDLFHHRLISLLYRCWEKYRYYMQYRPGATDQFSQWMFALIGLGGADLRQESHIYWPRLLPYLGLLGMHTHSAAVLAGVVSHYFGGVAAEIEQCVGRWVPLAAEQRHMLGQANGTLGEDSTLGKRFYDRSGKFRLHIGPLDFATFQKFLPPGSYYGTARELVMFGMRDQLEFDVELVLRVSDIPDLVLSADSPCRLGWSTWLGPRPEQDVSVIFPGRNGQHNL
jgi:type VI secretion system protein ImpH